MHFRNGEGLATYANLLLGLRPHEFGGQWLVVDMHRQNALGYVDRTLSWS